MYIFTASSFPHLNMENASVGLPNSPSISNQSQAMSKVKGRILAATQRTRATPNNLRYSLSGGPITKDTDLSHWCLYLMQVKSMYNNT